VTTREEVLAMSVDELRREGLSQRYINGLIRINIRTIGRLVDSTAEDVCKSNVISSVTGVGGIRLALRKLGKRHGIGPLNLKEG
jgi:hypothetical protein